MIKIDAEGISFQELNERINAAPEKELEVFNVRGQRYIGASLSGYHITIHGTPGNASACYMNDSTLVVHGNAQDALGDTMNLGRVIVHGRCGDTCGYAMRGGEIYIQDDSGYRTGIHMKEYKDQRPLIVVGGESGDFLGEYLAGGVLLVLGLKSGGKVPVGKHCGTGMHGGVIYLRGKTPPDDLPAQVNVLEPTREDLAVIAGYVERYCEYFGGSPAEIMKAGFIKLTPNSKNPYKQLYTNNW